MYHKIPDGTLLLQVNQNASFLRLCAPSAAQRHAYLIREFTGGEVGQSLRTPTSEGTKPSRLGDQFYGRDYLAIEIEGK